MQGFPDCLKPRDSHHRNEDHASEKPCPRTGVEEQNDRNTEAQSGCPAQQIRPYLITPVCPPSGTAFFSHQSFHRLDAHPADRENLLPVNGLKQSFDVVHGAINVAGAE